MVESLSVTLEKNKSQAEGLLPKLPSVRNNCRFFPCFTVKHFQCFKADFNKRIKVGTKGFGFKCGMRPTAFFTVAYNSKKSNAVDSSSALTLADEWSGASASLAFHQATPPLLNPSTPPAAPSDPLDNHRQTKKPACHHGNLGAPLLNPHRHTHTHTLKPRR